MGMGPCRDPSPLARPSLSLTSGQSAPGLHPLLLIHHCRRQQVLMHPVWKGTWKTRVRPPCGGNLGPKSLSKDSVLSGKVQQEPQEKVWVGLVILAADPPFPPLLWIALEGAAPSPVPAPLALHPLTTMELTPTRKCPRPWGQGLSCLHLWHSSKQGCPWGWGWGGEWGHLGMPS